MTGSYELEIRSRDDGRLMVRAEFPAGDAGRMAAYRMRWLRGSGSAYYSVTTHPDGRATDSRLTASQQRIMDRLRETGKPLVLNGRVTRVIEALEGLGLVTADWDSSLDAAKGRLRWRITVTLAPAVRA